MAVPKRATALIQPICCINCIQCVPKGRPLRSSAMESTEASDPSPKQVSSMTTWFQMYMELCYCVSITLYNKEVKNHSQEAQKDQTPPP